MSEKTFKVVGVSTLNGETRVRFANDISRVKVLSRNGHTDIMLVELSEPLTKAQAVQVIASADEFQHTSAQEAINDFFNREASREEAANKPKRPRKAAKVSEPEAEQSEESTEEVEIESSELEDEPF